MLKITFSQEEIEALHYERYHHPHPRVQRKMEALWLKSRGLPHNQIATLTGITTNTLRTYLYDFRDGGIEKLKEVNFRQPRSALEDHKDTIEAHFRQHPFSTINQAVHVIEQLTGIKRSPTQVREFLRRMGLKRRKVGMVPAKADVDAQEAFLKKTPASA